jgi:hypothetical protein
MIRARQRADRRVQAKLVETQTKFLVGAMHGAAGSKVGEQAAASVSFFGKGDAAKPKIADYESVKRWFPV